MCFASLRVGAAASLLLLSLSLASDSPELQPPAEDYAMESRQSPNPPSAPESTAGAGVETPKDEDAVIRRIRRELFGIDSDAEPEPELNSSSSSSSSDDDDDGPEDFTEEGLRAKDAVLSVSKSVVALTASADSADGEPPSAFACTGTVVAHQGSAAWILTSATLIRKGESDTEVHDLPNVKIEVLLHNKKAVEGQVLMYDLHYNIAIVSIECEVDLPVVVLHDLPDSYLLTPSPVIAVARKFESGSLQMKRGETFRIASKLDCDELMVSTCQTEQVKIFIGGLLLDLEKRVVGMNFIGENNTPFLPVEVVGRCLKHFRKFRYTVVEYKFCDECKQVKKPWLGIRGRTLNMLELKELQEICDKYHKPPSGILVDMIPEVSTAYCGGMEAGDIINQLSGVTLHSIAQLTTMLLDTMEVVVNMQPVILQATVLRPRDRTTYIADLKIMECPPGECDILLRNRWRLPPPKLYWWGPPELSEWVDDSD